MRVVLAALLGLGLWVVPAGAQQGPLRWGADAEGGAPYVFFDPDAPGGIAGFEVDIAMALAKELGRPMQFCQYDFKRLVEGLERGDIDLAMNGLEVTEDRAKRVLFSRPYYVFRLQWVVRNGETRCSTLARCVANGGLVGTLENTSASRFLQSLGARIAVYDSQVTPFEDLRLGRLDGLLVDVPIAKAMMGSWPQLGTGDQPIPGRGFYAVAFRKTDQALARAVDQALDALIKKGELEAILRRWNLWDQSQEELWPPGFFALEGGSTPKAVGQFATFRPVLSFSLLLKAAGVTVFLACASMVLAVVLGTGVALARVFGPPWLSGLSVAYVEFFRGVPALLLLYLLYFGLPAAWRGLTGQEGMHISPFVTAVLGLGLVYGAYEAEIYRAALLAVPASQWEAAASLGLTWGQTLRHVVVPQALRTVVPPSTTDFVALFKDTSLAGTITVVELAKQYQILSTSGASFTLLVQAGIFTALLYLAMSVPLGALARRWERRMAPGL
mgnify:CR=1 FL=1